MKMQNNLERIFKDLTREHCLVISNEVRGMYQKASENVSSKSCIDYNRAISDVVKMLESKYKEND